MQPRDLQADNLRGEEHASRWNLAHTAGDSAFIYWVHAETIVFPAWREAKMQFHMRFPCLLYIWFPQKEKERAKRKRKREMEQKHAQAKKQAHCEGLPAEDNSSGESFYCWSSDSVGYAAMSDNVRGTEQRWL